MSQSFKKIRIQGNKEKRKKKMGLLKYGFNGKISSDELYQSNLFLKQTRKGLV